MNKLLVKILFLIALLPLLSCQKKENKEIIPDEFMKEILIDIHLAEAITGRKGGLAVHRDMLRNDIIEDILEKYGVSKETFLDSYQYYMEHPTRMDSIYVQIIRHLEENSEEPGNENSSKTEDQPTKKGLNGLTSEQSLEKE